MTPLQRIKLAHTAVWVFFVVLIGNVIYAGWADAVTTWTWIAVGLICLEGLVLLVNDGKCPMTDLAAQHGEPTADNFDIYLPEWLARHNVAIFTTLFMAGLVLVIIRTFL